MSDYKIRFFRLGEIRLNYIKYNNNSKENKRGNFFEILEKINKNIEGNKIVISSDKKNILKIIETKQNSIKAVFFKSTDSINPYTLDNANFEDNPLDSRLKPEKETLVNAFRFIVYKKDLRENIVYESLRTPRTSDLKDLFQNVFEKRYDYSVKVIDYFENDINEIDFYKIDFEYLNKENSSNIKADLNDLSLEEKITGQIKTNKRKDIPLNLIRLFHKKDKIIIRSNSEDKEIFEMNFNNFVKLKGILKKSDGNNEEVDILNYVVKTSNKYTKQQLYNHNLIFSDLHNFYADNVKDTI